MFFLPEVGTVPLVVACWADSDDDDNLDSAWGCCDEGCIAGAEDTDRVTVGATAQLLLFTLVILE